MKLLLTSVLAGILGVSAGCADQMTFANDSRREGLAYFNEGDYVNAIAALNNATSQDPRDYKSYYDVGRAYEAMGSHLQAISAFRTCLGTMPLTPEGQEDLSTRYKAMDALASAIAKSPTCSMELDKMEKGAAGKASADDLWMLAKTERYAGDADAAVETYNKAVLIAPENFALAKEAGLYQAIHGQNERAAFSLRKAYAVNSGDDQVNTALRKLGVVPDLVRKYTGHS